MATTEVAKALEALDFLQEVNVYGVTVPGAQAWEVWGGYPACLPELVQWAQGTEASWSATAAEPLPTPHPGHEGRAGMAALVPRPPHSLDLGQLYTHVSENLPPYAWPRFLRLQVTSHSFCDPHPTYTQQLMAP